MVVSKVHDLPNRDDHQDQRCDDAPDDGTAANVRFSVVDKLVGDLLLLDVRRCSEPEDGEGLAVVAGEDGNDDVLCVPLGLLLLVGIVDDKHDGDLDLVPGVRVVVIAVGGDAAEVVAEVGPLGLDENVLGRNAQSVEKAGHFVAKGFFDAGKLVIFVCFINGFKNKIKIK